MLSLAQLYWTILDLQNRETRKHPEPYKLSDDKDVWQIFADQADNTFQEMLGHLSGFYIVTTGASQSYKENEDAKKDLDKVLTNFAQAVGGFKIDTEAVGGGAEHFEFDMTYTKTNCQLNMDGYQKAIPKFNKIMEFVTEKNLAAYGAGLSQPVKNKA
ncbi:hypothetical protein J3E69DRAFT_372439 [Trichoderma sp. SZMC 28015]